MSLVKAYATEDVTLVGKGSIQADGTYDFTGATSTVKARVMDKNTKDYSKDGWELKYDRVFWFPSNVTITEGDRLTWNSVNHEVVEIRVGRSLTGVVDHTRVGVLIRGV